MGITLTVVDGPKLEPSDITARLKTTVIESLSYKKKRRGEEKKSRGTAGAATQPSPDNVQRSLGSECNWDHGGRTQ